MENDINTLKLIEMASAHLKVQGIQSGIVPMPGTDKSIIIGSPAEVVELMPDLRGAIPAAWHNFARAIADLPHGAEANIAGMQSKAAQLLAAEDARAKVLPKDEGAAAEIEKVLFGWKRYALSTSLDNRNDDLCSLIEEMESIMQNKPTAQPTKIESMITHCYYINPGEVHRSKWPDPSAADELHPSLDLVTICILVMDNGALVIGESTSSNTNNYDAETRRKIAHQNAMSKIAAAQPVAANAGIEGLDKWNASRKHLGAMQMCDGGNYLKRVDVERLLATQSAQGAQPDLHNAIMNLRCDVQNCILGGAQAEMAYKMGHRDARHGAAELVGAHEAGEAAPAAPLQTMDDTTRDEALADAEKAVEEALAVARDEALEEAAKLIEEEVPCSCCFSDDEVALATNLAAAIRALMKSSSPVSGEAGEKGGELQAVAAFLMGEADLEGVTFGERHPTKAGAFWWRHNLRAALHAAGLRPERKDQG